MADIYDALRDDHDTQRRLSGLVRALGLPVRGGVGGRLRLLLGRLLGLSGRALLSVGLSFDLGVGLRLLL